MTATKACAVGLIAAGLSLAVANAGFGTTLTFDGGAGDADWFKAANWNPNEVPATNDDQAIITSGFSVTFNFGGAERIGSLTVGSGGGSGVLNVTGGTLDVNRTGSPATANNIRVGDGSGSLGTIFIAQGAAVQSRGAAAHFEIGDSAGGFGTVTVAGSFAPFKFFDLVNGRLEMLSTADTMGATGSAFNENGNHSQIRSGGTLAYAIDGTDVGVLDIRTQVVNNTTLFVDGNSHLEVTLEAGPAYVPGQQWTLIRYENLSGQFSEGTSFTNSQGYSFSVDYQGGSADNDVVLTLTAIPEPDTLLLAAMGLLGLLGRRWRKRFMIYDLGFNDVGQGLP